MVRSFVNIIVLATIALASVRGYDLNQDVSIEGTSRSSVTRTSHEQLIRQRHLTQKSQKAEKLPKVPPPPLHDDDKSPAPTQSYFPTFLPTGSALPTITSFPTPSKSAKSGKASGKNESVPKGKASGKGESVPKGKGGKGDKNGKGGNGNTTGKGQMMSSKSSKSESSSKKGKGASKKGASKAPSLSPSPTVTASPSDFPTAIPSSTIAPTMADTPSEPRSLSPTEFVSPNPTAEIIAPESSSPSAEVLSTSPSATPSSETPNPSAAPSVDTQNPSAAPSIDTQSPSASAAPTTDTQNPSAAPSIDTQSPSASAAPTTDTQNPSAAPSIDTLSPSASAAPTTDTQNPSAAPSTDTLSPSAPPSVDSESPSSAPSVSAAPSSSASPSTVPTSSVSPSISPSGVPSGVPTSSPSINPSSAPSVDPGVPEALTAANFETTLDLANVDERYQDAFVTSADRWGSIIVGDMPGLLVTDDTRDGVTCKNLPDSIDDVFVCASVSDIDGVSGVLGSSGPEYGAMVGDFVVPVIGSMRFDSADIDDLVDSSLLESVITHEMGRIYGIGSLWSMNKLAKGSSSSCSYSASSKATAEYQKLSECDTSLPLDDCSHTDKSCFKNEFLTGFSGDDVVLSRMTIASLEDMGYTVNYDAADDYSVADMDASCVCKSDALKVNEALTSEHTKASGKPSVRKLGTGVSKIDSQQAHLSLSGRLEAETYGQSLLKEAKLRKKHTIEREGFVYLGDQVVSVLYMEKGQIYGVEVRGE